MRRIKKITIVLFLFSVLSIISLSFINLKVVSNYVLENIVKTNIKIGSVKLKGINVEINDVEIKELNGEDVGHVEKIIVKLNPFLPSRIRGVYINGGNLKLVQNKGNILNVENILPKKGNVSRISNVSNIILNNITVKYINKEYEKEIYKNLENVSGKISNFLNDYDINIKGESGKEKLGIRLSKLPSKKQYFISLFTNKISDKDKISTQEFEFKNVKLNEELSQFIPTKDIVVNEGIINGNLKIENKNIFSKLDVDVKELVYKEYKDKIYNAKANIKANGDVVKISSYGYLANNEKLNLYIDFYTKKDKLKLKVKSSHISLDNIEKYKPLAMLKGRGSLNIDVDTDISLNKEVKFENINATISSKKLNMYGVDFSNLGITARTRDKENINIILNTDVAKDKIKLHAKTNLLYSINKNNIKGEYILHNKMDNLGINIDDIKGNVDITPPIKGSATLNSKQLKGNLELKDNKLNFNIKNIKNISYKKDKIKIDVENINLLGQYDINSKQFNANINAKANGNIDNKYVKIGLSSKVDNNIIKTDANIINSAGNLKINGITKLNNLSHEYNINGNIETLTLMQILNIDKNGATKGNTLPINIKAKLKGVKKDISLEYDIYSKYFNYYVTAYDTKIKGYAKNILGDNKDIKATLNMAEVWKKYHRLKGLNANISYVNDNLIIHNIENEFVSGDIIYNLKEKILHSKLNLNNYVMYTVYDIPDINVYINNLNIEANGHLDNLKSTMIILPSEVRYKDKYIGLVNGNAYLEDNNVTLNLKMNDSIISGIYDVKNNNFDINVNLSQKIQEIFNVEGLRSDIKANMHITGKPSDINMNIDTNLSSIKYKKVSIPDISFKAHYEKGNIKDILKTGYLYVDTFDLTNDGGQNIYHTNFKLDLANLNIDYELKDKIIDLDKLGKDFKGKLKVSTKLKGNQDDFFFNVDLQSNEMVVKGHKINNFVLDGQADKTGININQGYLEYEKNPILIEGYMFFNPRDYMFRVVAENFNMDFLNIYPDISNAKGIANVNFIASKGEVEGKIDVSNMNLKTKDVDIKDFNVNILMNNKDIDIDKFYGSVNGGSVKLNGQITIPDIPDNIQELDNIDLGKINLDLELDHVGVNIKDNKFVISSELKLKGERLLGYIQFNKGSLEDLSFIDLMNKNKKSKEKDNLILKKIKVVINNILKRYVVNVDFNMDEPLNIDIPSYLVLKDISGKVMGNTNIIFSNGIPSLNGVFEATDGKFILNGNEFNIEILEVTMTDSVDPFINLKAITEINGEVVEIIISSKLSKLNIEFRSSTNKSRDEILSLLAFKGNKFTNATIKSVGANVLNFATETAVNQFISKFTNKIGKKIGLTKFDFGTNIGDKDKLAITNFIDNTSIQLHLQGKVVKNKNIYWNVKTDIPLNAKKSNIKYDVNVSYKLADGFGANLGIKDAGDNEYNENKFIKKFNFYTGVNYSNKFNNFEEFINSIKTKFEKREKLEHDKIGSNYGKDKNEKQIQH